MIYKYKTNSVKHYSIILKKDQALFAACKAVECSGTNYLLLCIKLNGILCFLAKYFRTVPLLRQFVFFASQLQGLGSVPG